MSTLSVQTCGMFIVDLGFRRKVMVIDPLDSSTDFCVCFLFLRSVNASTRAVGFSTIIDQLIPSRRVILSVRSTNLTNKNNNKYRSTQRQVSLKMFLGVICFVYSHFVETKYPCGLYRQGTDPRSSVSNFL